MYITNNDLFCLDMATTPNPAQGLILVTGVTGYIGGRLAADLLNRGYRLRLLLRSHDKHSQRKWPGAEVVVGDVLDSESLGQALHGVQVAYYLIHSLQLGPGQFDHADIRAATLFRDIAMEKKLQRIIYLGGLGDTHGCQSKHLASRMQVGHTLNSSSVPATILRAGVIIGSGSASYEIIKHLVLNSPLLILPRWAKNRCQPISVRDTIKYLVGVLELPQTAGLEFDIGSDDILSYEQMLRMEAEVLQKRILILYGPYRDIQICSYIASLLTPVPAPVIHCLMEGLKDDVLCRNKNIRDYIDFQPMPYKEALVKALSREEQDKVYTRWSDAYPPAHDLALKLHELPRPAEYSCSYSLSSNKDARLLFDKVCQIGGKDGWFRNNWMWRMRGFIDRILLGVGSSRGRKKSLGLEVNDVIDFWRIEDIEKMEDGTVGINQARRLLLRAEMKLPGKAWLEFIVKPGLITVNAYYDTSSLLGRVYWYVFLPFHHIIFNDLLEEIDKRA